MSKNQHWITDSQGQALHLYTIRNSKGMTASFCDLGATLVGLTVPNAENKPLPCVLRYDTPEHFLQDQHFLGVTVGRYCNRIAGAHFELNGISYPLTANEGPNQLHGGEGFAKRVWTCLELTDECVRFGLISENGDQGFPGKLSVEAQYELSDDNALIFTWTAQSDADTVASLTNHAYFNLGGTDDVLDYELQLDLDHVTPIDGAGIPTGAIDPVDGSAFDFREACSLRDRLAPLDPALASAAGLDHNFCASPGSWDGRLKKQATLVSPKTDMQLTVYSTLPGLQVYTGNHLAKSAVFRTYQGICLETQFFPNSPNETHFPSAVVKAGETMTHQTRFEFCPGK